MRILETDFNGGVSHPRVSKGKAPDFFFYFLFSFFFVFSFSPSFDEIHHLFSQLLHQRRSTTLSVITACPPCSPSDEHSKSTERTSWFGCWLPSALPPNSLFNSSILGSLLPLPLVPYQHLFVSSWECYSLVNEFLKLN